MFGSYQEAINILKNLRTGVKDSAGLSMLSRAISVLEAAWTDEEMEFALKCIELEERDIIHERSFKLINGGKSGAR